MSKIFKDMGLLPFEALADAIVTQAAKDYIDLKMGFPIKYENSAKKGTGVTVKAIRKFFLPDKDYPKGYAGFLTGIDGEDFLNKMDERIKKMELKYLIYRSTKTGKYYLAPIGCPEMPDFSTMTKNYMTIIDMWSKAHGLSADKLKILLKREGLNQVNTGDYV